MTKFVLSLIAIALVVSFIKLGSVTLFDYDEAVFAEVTKEMLQSGDWITPNYNGEAHFDKPILFYWVMAVSYKLFGINEFGARFPSALASVLLILSIFFFVRRFRGREAGVYAAASLLLSLYFLVYSRAAVIDMIMILFMTLSLFSFYLSLMQKKEGVPGAGPKRYIYGFYLFSALAFLAKGLIGIVFPFGIIILFLLITEGGAGIKKVLSLKGTILFLIIAAPWYIAQLMINGMEFIQQFFIKHHFARYVDVNSGHEGPVYYYIAALLVGLFPGIAFLPAGIRRTFRERDRLSLFVFIWFISVLAFFSFSTTKLPNYILPAVPAAAILISSGMSMRDRKWLKYSNIFMAVLAALAGAAYVLSEKYLLKFGIPDTAWMPAVAAVMFAMSALGLYNALAGKKLYEYAAVLMLVALSIFSVKVFYIANHKLQGTLYKYSLHIKEKLHGDGKLITYMINNPSVIFYSDHKAVSLRNKDELAAFMRSDEPYGVQFAITKTDEAGTLENAGFKLLEKDGEYAILERR